APVRQNEPLAEVIEHHDPANRIWQRGHQESVISARVHAGDGARRVSAEAVREEPLRFDQTLGGIGRCRIELQASRASIEQSSHDGLSTAHALLSPSRGDAMRPALHLWEPARARPGSPRRATIRRRRYRPWEYRNRRTRDRPRTRLAATPFEQAGRRVAPRMDSDGCAGPGSRRESDHAPADRRKPG